MALGHALLIRPLRFDPVLPRWSKLWKKSPPHSRVRFIVPNLRNFVEKEVIDIALGAGAILRSYWGKTGKIQQKKFFWDLVTEADLASEAYIIEALRKQFPGHEILSEEAGLSAPSRSDYQWVIDPLDGTTNFTHQFPMVSVSIGLLVQGQPTFGVVYNPIFNELFVGSKGKGATLNGVPLQISKVEKLEQSLLATGFAYDRKETNENNYAEFFHMTNICQGVRRGGSAAIDLAYVAAGRLDGYWERGLKPWDIAAGIVLVAEAGGIVTSYEGGPIDLFSGRILAAGPFVHPLLSHELQIVKAQKNCQ
jgi:myo-inositol-1(or 4)-monophosphatase